MNYLSVENLEKNLGERTLFSGLNFGMSRGDKVALVAGNGTGKSSLLRIIAGVDQPTDGVVVMRKGVRHSFLDQEPDLPVNLTIGRFITSSHPELQEAVTQYHKAVETSSESNRQLLIYATARMDELHAWDYERRLTELLHLFEISELDMPIEHLSGGQKKRLALAVTLLDDPDLLILDEPTNHLDIKMIEWLEEYLLRAGLTLLMVTHDRYFLQNVCNTILEMDQGNLYQHKGNYSFFMQKRAERQEVKRIEIEKAGKKVKSELDWMRRMPKARGTISKARIQQFYQTEGVAKSGSRAPKLNLNVKMNRIGGKILEMKKVYKSFGDLNMLASFDYTFKKGECIGIVGPNGVGKSTFLKLITGELSADSGKINRGSTVVFGHYSQDGLEFKPEMRVIDVLREHADVIELANGTKLTASQFLNHFMFPPDQQYSPVSKLSGGEKRRLHLMTVLIKNPNFLMLDEPTNDLDLLTLNKLEDFLLDFAGCLILVSHDRYFMNTLVDHLFIFTGEGKIKDYNGTYLEYKESQNKKEKESNNKSGKKVWKERASTEKAAKKRLTFKEKLEFEALSKEIDLLEKEKKELEEFLSSGSVDFEVLNEKSARISLVIGLLDQKGSRWLDLSEYA